MDRNISALVSYSIKIVALRKESVDRNCKNLPKQSIHHVALRKESVDRNIFAGKAPYMENASLSARRAWIEMAELAKRGEELKGRSPQGERG